MNPLIAFCFVLMLLFGLSGCSSTPAQRPVILNPEKANLVDSQAVRAKLLQQYKDWQGAQHRLGGLTKQGIDCSGLVYVIYRETLGIALPRTTEQQAVVGVATRRNDLRAGDLVFFKTGFKARHVGIYIENGEFLHVSTKKGVMISKLSDDYWLKRYWQARRVTS